MKRKDLKNIQDSGFKVPKDYFENFENTILNHARLKEKVSHSGFSTPEGYFDTVEEHILNRISTKKSTKVISLIQKKSIIYASSIAAAIVLLFSIVDFNKTVTYDSLEFETVENYILNEDIDSEELASLFNDSDFSEDGFNAISFSEDDIENYVNDNLDLNDLYIE
ncbi:hypothetical protein ACFS5M_10155 [Lacinutrix iliipiscaria]|uniref:Uncharacterized protein n=1 Tax=Lacinutrix iliipiscaria TaxID=1230532 RepID=A0ABW5WS94_9FLAO